jgi:hypothetical protein
MMEGTQAPKIKNVLKIFDEVKYQLIWEDGKYEN